MPTKAEIIGRAVALGYGEPSALERTFERWQEFGGVGEAMQRRHHGPAEYHEIQSEIFLDSLKATHGDNKVKRLQLANPPVVLWLQGREGISISQVRRAFRTCEEELWKNRDDTSFRSKDYLSSRDVAAFLSSPDASMSARQDLQKVIWSMLRRPSSIPVSEKRWTSALEAALGADRVTIGVDQIKIDAKQAHFQMFCQFVALSFLDTITVDDPANDELWKWARGFAMRSMGLYTGDREELEAVRAIARGLAGLDIDYIFAQTAVPMLASPFAIAALRLAGLLDGEAWHETWEAPPSAPILEAEVARRVAEGNLGGSR
jgi:hypothetical protein